MERMSEEIQKFRTDSKGLNTPETFVRYAKLQREIVSKEKQLKELGVKLQSIHKTQFFKAKRVLEVTLTFKSGSFCYFHSGFSFWECCWCTEIAW